ncbi:MAG: DNA cytosine methyltransferase [Patescibacteria group bacterium]|nr:DNA cytosine methyltransferase [Patescibacteria group bacterium]MDE2015892.1 DNA cytosine methyltransferase [Patescibacteria group bacterium]
MRILNLYAGIGGNRKLWGDSHEITAVEIDPKIAAIYQDFFPQDRVLVEDAHAYLLAHFEEYDFIWSSPPCPSHSHIRKELAVEQRKQNKPVFPDMKLYEEIVFLQGYFKGKFCVENVISWYPPLIKPREISRHYFWTNFLIRDIDKKSRKHMAGIKVLETRKGFNLDKYTGIDKRAILRNCVEPETGLHILNEALEVKEIIGNQKSLF